MIDQIYDADGERERLVELFARRYVGMLRAVHQLLGIALNLDPNGWRLDDSAVRRVVLETRARAVRVDQTTQLAISAMLAEGQSRGLSTWELANGTADGEYAGIDGLFKQTWRSRGQTVARTELLYAQNVVALDRYHASGIIHEVEARDGGTTDSDGFCESRNGRRYPMNNPPEQAHPNAVLAGARFVPYGRLRSMVAADFDGLAVRITIQCPADGGFANGESSSDSGFTHARGMEGSDLGVMHAGAVRRVVTTTIGLNHPVLTRRGFVKAGLLNEGDDVVYDLRVDRALAMKSGYSDLEEMPFVEDAFATVRALSRHSSVPATGNDLHGDGVFCQGEIEVVFPERKLLNEWDLGVLEELGEHDLVGANVQLHAEPRGRASIKYFERVRLAATSRMRGGSVRPVHDFAFAKVVGVELVSFTGRAFDASTDYSLYCNDGIVVSNCTLALIPIVDEHPI